MAPVRVAVNGYGTIGKRVADAVAAQPDMTLVGVAKTRPNFEAELAQARGYAIYVAGDGDPAAFRAAGIEVRGGLDEMVRTCDVVVDCAPESVGRKNAETYRKVGVRAIFQGGEAPDVAEASFNAAGNYALARGKRSLRVVSCNTTGLARAVSVLRPRFGVADWEATLVRRAADPAEISRGPVNGIIPAMKIPSHHGPDVRTIFPDLPISTMALVVPTTLMHVHANHVRLERPPPSAAEVLAAFRAAPRFRLFRKWEHVEGTPQVMEFARDRALGRPDMPENVLWEEGLSLQGPDLRFFQGIHQESIVVPENVDAIRAMFELAPDGPSSMALTDRALAGGVRPSRSAGSP
jgi:glyceraldehyde-3-phosphate dehydrogenase (NAD(P))